MSEVKDPSIKLFGKTIKLLTQQNYDKLNKSCANKDPIQTTPKNSEGEFMKTEEKVELINEDPRTPNVEKETSTVDQLIDQATSSGMSEDPKTPNADKETSSPATGEKEDPSYLNNSDEKTLKKPEKILPCPRCNSMDTKFCYYNNYNISQPRHFCKSCQRYWTAGGTMRSVPVGSGRRKNKSSAASHYRDILASEAVQASRANAANGTHQPNGSVLTFASDSHICESMASSLILAQKSQNCVANRSQGKDQRNPGSYRGGEIVADHSSGSSSTVSNPNNKGFTSGSETVLNNSVQGSVPHVPCFPMTPWPCQWNGAQWRPPSAQPAFGPSGYPVSFYPVPPYWGCNVPNTWNMPWLSPQLSSSDHSVHNSQTLGKHSRDGSMLRPSKLTKEDPSEEKESERGVLNPKTLRINDPNEVAKSSIWSTLGIKTENTVSGTGSSLFKAFLPKGTNKNHTMEISPALQVNPAAMSRSLHFQESS